jgi:hypothetical protein
MKEEPKTIITEPPKGGGGAWVLVVLSLVVILAIAVVGIGFIPVTRTESYPCTKTETYTYYDTVPSTVTNYEDMDYNSWGFDTYESWWDNDIWEYLNVRNTDNEAGYFEVTFYCMLGSTWYSKSQTKWLDPGEVGEYSVEFGRGGGTPWDYKYPVVTPDTKQVASIVYEQVQRTGTRQVQSTCYRTVTERLLW